MSPERSAAVATPAVASGETTAAAAAPETPAAREASAAERASAASQHSQATQHDNICANCGAAVSGEFCGRCGQRREHEMHSVLHFSREAFEDLTHADSRLWRTMIALLFKPGYLTREFIEGRRVRYLPPIRLYLVLSVLFFLVVGSHT